MGDPRSAAFVLKEIYSEAFVLGFVLVLWLVELRAFVLVLVRAFVLVLVRAFVLVLVRAFVLVLVLVELRLPAHLPATMVA